MEISDAMVDAAWAEFEGRPFHVNQMYAKTDMRDAIVAALAAHKAEAGAVKVKPLEWELPSVGPDDYAHIGRCDALGFLYQVELKGNSRKPWVVTRSIDIQPFGWADTQDGAKSIANADAELRIRSALSSPSALEGWRDISTAPKDGREILIWLGAPWSKVEKAKWHQPWKNWQTGDNSIDPSEEYYGIGFALPTHWMPLPAAPIPKQEGGNDAT